MDQDRMGWGGEERVSGGGVKRGANDPVVMSGSAEELERGS
jgi:hypothetical protein